MTDNFIEIDEPALPSTVITPAQAIHGPLIPAQQQILLYSAEQWELFIKEWVHFCLKAKYVSVQRFSASGDRSIDIAGFTDDQKLKGVWDNYQCKHYDHPLRPSDVWAEIGKIVWYTFKGDYKAPRKYYFVAPKGIGTSLLSLLSDVDRLKSGLIENWDKHVRHKIREEEIILEGQLLAFVSAFNFKIFDSKTGLQVIEDHRTCPYHIGRFGGGLPPRPAPGDPPEEVAPTESKYVGHLLAAYADHKKTAVEDIDTLKAWPKLNDHFGRQRESFYHAESLRVFARDTVPPGTFESLQDDIHSGVVDVCQDVHPDGYVRVLKVTQAARELQITSNVLVSCTKPKDRDGICHQLANEDKLKWTE